MDRTTVYVRAPVRRRTAQATSPPAVLVAALEPEMMGVPHAHISISDPDDLQTKRRAAGVQRTRRARGPDQSPRGSPARAALTIATTQETAVARWNAMSPTEQRYQRTTCAREGHRWTRTDFSPRIQVCLACCEYQEIDHDDHAAH